MSELVNTRTGEVVPERRYALDFLPDAERMLAECVRAQDAQQIEDIAEAARVYAKQMGLGVSSINYATAIKICAGIRLDELVRQGRVDGTIARRGRPPKNRRGPAVFTLEDLELDHQRLAEAHKLAKKYTADEIRALADEYSAAGEELSRRQLLNGEAVQQSLTNEWYTPAVYLDAARATLGGIDLDPASCAEANETVKAERFFAKDDDGLEQDWRGRVWLNPPYGRIAGDFVERLVDQYDKGSVTAAVTLVNAHCTDTRWFQRLWDHALCFTDHRINFSKGTEARSGSTHGSALAYLGPDRPAFAEAFSRYGAVVVRYQ